MSVGVANDLNQAIELRSLGVTEQEVPLDDLEKLSATFFTKLFIDDAKMIDGTEQDLDVRSQYTHANLSQPGFTKITRTAIHEGESEVRYAIASESSGTKHFIKGVNSFDGNFTNIFFVDIVLENNSRTELMYSIRYDGPLVASEFNNQKILQIKLLTVLR